MFGYTRPNTGERLENIMNLDEFKLPNYEDETPTERVVRQANENRLLEDLAEQQGIESMSISDLPFDIAEAGLSQAGLPVAGAVVGGLNLKKPKNQKKLFETIKSKVAQTTRQRGS